MLSIEDVKSKSRDAKMIDELLAAARASEVTCASFREIDAGGKRVLMPRSWIAIHIAGEKEIGQNVLVIAERVET